MSNLLDYITWRGDLSFSAAPFNEVDGLILSQMAMLRWERGLKPGEAAAVSALREPMREKPVSVGFTAENDYKFWMQLTQSSRFGWPEVSDFVHRLDERAEEQFAAIAAHLPDRSVFVAFRGTDSTLVGWKEDCNMAFSQRVPAQEAAREYLEAISEKYPGALRVGGHSKGGNLAMYAATTASSRVRDQILGVYNYDGPGLSDLIDAQSLYLRMTGRLHSYVPQGSIVGMLLNHPDDYAVVKSTSVSILQHDPYTWQVEGPRFVRMTGLSRDSARFDIGFRAWLSHMERADRETLIDTVFNVLGAADSPTFGPEYWSALARNPHPVLSALQSIDAEHLKRITRMITDLGAAVLKAADDAP